MTMEKQFTKYEIARIIGARALQIAMDAPLLLAIPEEELKAMRYDSIRIAERELKEDVLPISIHRPVPKKRKDKITAVKDDVVSDEELAEREQKEEKEIESQVGELGLIQGDQDEDFTDADVPSVAPGEEA